MGRYSSAAVPGLDRDLGQGLDDGINKGAGSASAVKVWCQH